MEDSWFEDSWFEDQLLSYTTQDCSRLQSTEQGWIYTYIYISIKQNKESRNRLIHIRLIYFQQRWHGNLMDERKIFLTNCARTLKPQKKGKNETSSLPIPYRKTNMKWIINLNIKAKTIEYIFLIHRKRASQSWIRQIFLKTHKA